VRRSYPDRRVRSSNANHSYLATTVREARLEEQLLASSAQRDQRQPERAEVTAHVRKRRLRPVASLPEETGHRHRAGSSVRRLLASVSLLVAGATVGAPGRAGAQIAVADTVRLRASSGQRLGGVVVAQDGQWLTVYGSSGDSARVRLDSLRSAEVLRGRRPRGWRAVGWGAAIGAGAGVVLAPLLKASDDRANAGNQGQGFDPLPSSLAFYEVATAGLGALLGTIVGAVVAPTKVHRWIQVRPIAVRGVEPKP
jgi:hypothetical protein